MATWRRCGGVFGVSLATLVFEITLTRVFSLAHGYHFAFLSVSTALLGFGASGSFLALFFSRTTTIHERANYARKRLNRKGAKNAKFAGKPRPAGVVSPLAILRFLRALGAFAVHFRLSLLAFLFSLSILGSYLAINYLPFDSYRIAWERIQFLYLAIYYLALATPFFFSGLIVGLLLARYPDQAHLIYAANLVGSAAGCLAVLGFLPWLGGSGTIIMAALWGLLGAAFFGLPRFVVTTLVVSPRAWRLKSLLWPYASLERPET